MDKEKYYEYITAAVSTSQGPPPPDTKNNKKYNTYDGSVGKYIEISLSPWPQDDPINDPQLVTLMSTAATRLTHWGTMNDVSMSNNLNL